MSLKEDLKSVIAELSPILAGFKLAVIVIGYFGFGSFAKWIISYWYPFTRWVWDQVAIFLQLPEFPLIVKDSLTALIFFMPLGITAINQRIRGVEKSEEKHRVSSALFGFLFLILICKDVITSIITSLSSSLEGFKSSELFQKYLDFIFQFSEISSGFIPLYMGFILGYVLLKFFGSITPISKTAFYRGFAKAENELKEAITRQRKRFFQINFVVALIFLPILGVGLVMLTDPINASAIMGAIGILIIIVASLLLAIFYAPKKLFITTGAAIAFILAAFFFEGFVVAKAFMENIPNG